MSLEYDIAQIKDIIASIDEGYSSAKALYVDTGKIPLKVLDHLASFDPTKEKGKYVEWMARMYARGDRHLTHYRVIKEFDDMCNKNIIQNKDINAYKSVEEVVDAVNQKRDVKTEGEKEREVKAEGVKIMFENDKIISVKPLTREASQLYGKGTKWCTSGEVYNHFADYFYDRGVNLYYFIPKTGNDDDKIALSVEKNGARTFYNAKDKQIDSHKAVMIIRSYGDKIDDK